MCRPFFTDIPARMSEAQLVISRSGASTVADVSVIGRPAIWGARFCPLPLRDEQTANARQLVDAGAALLMTEAQFDAPNLTMALQNLLSDGAMAADMARKAVACSVPDATDRLVQLVENLAEARKT